MISRFWRWLFGSYSPPRSPMGYDELADKVTQVQRQVRMLELEWESTYNKLRALIARLNKRAEREAANEDGVASLEGGPALAGVGAAGGGLSRAQPAAAAAVIRTPRRNY